MATQERLTPELWVPRAGGRNPPIRPCSVLDKQVGLTYYQIVKTYYSIVNKDVSMLAPSVAAVNAVLMLGNERPLRAYTITKRTGAKSHAMTLSALKTLQNMGLVTADERQGHVEYAPNQNSPYYEIARRMALVDLGLGRRLPDDSRVLAVWVYGSLADDQQTTESDLDVFIVGKADPAAVRRSFEPISQMIGRGIDVLIMTDAETRAAAAVHDEHVEAALKGVPVWGKWS
jgi:predicted nucleotidyltransferase